MKTGGGKMALSDRELLARLIQCEAGGEDETYQNINNSYLKFLLQIHIIMFILLLYNNYSYMYSKKQLTHIKCVSCTYLIYKIHQSLCKY